MNIKRILAGTLAALTAGATMLFAAAASPASLGDYVVTDTNKITSPLIVIGSSAADATAYPKDVAAAADIAAALAGYATKPSVIPGAGLGLTVTNGAPIQKASEYLHINDTFNSVKISFTEDDLSILAPGEVEQKGATSVTYIQRISTGDQKVVFDNSYPDATEPKLYVKFKKDDTAYTYKVIFTPALNITKAAGKTINLLGKEYLIDPNENNLDNETIVLYAAGAQEITLQPGETQDVNIEGVTHTIGVRGVAGADRCTGDVKCAVLTIDGVDEGVDEGEILTIDDTDVWVKRIDVFDYPAEGAVTLSIGAEKITFKHGEGIFLGGSTTPIEGTESLNITSIDAQRIVKIELPYKPADDVYLMEGDTMNDSVFGAFKILFNGIIPDVKDSVKDKITVKKSGDSRVVLEFTNKLGNTYSQTIYYFNGTDDSFDLTDGSARTVHVSAGSTVSEKDYFIITDGEDSFILQYYDHDNTNNVTKIKDLGTNKIIEVSDTYGYITIGDHEIPFTYNTDGTITVDANSTIYTKSGATIELDSSPSGNTTSINILEPDFSGYVGAPTPQTIQIQINASDSADEITEIETNVSTYAKEDTDYSYGLTAGGTYIVQVGADTDKVELYTYEAPAIAAVAFGPDPKIGATAAVQAPVLIQEPITKLDNEVGLDVGSDLILIGGPCANKLVAEVMGLGEGEDCVAKFMEEVEKCGGSKQLIQEYELANGKKALVIAGLNADDTRAAAARAMKNDFRCM